MSDDELEFDPGEDEPVEPDWDEEAPRAEFVHWPRDPQLDPAKAELIRLIEEDRTRVFYGRQIEVILEDKYFHWITHKALKELTTDQVISTERRETASGSPLRLYWSKRNRYPKRAAAAIVTQVEKHSNPEMTRAIGHHAEVLFGIAAGREGFRLSGPSVRSYQGRVWIKTDHNLDWIFEKDGIGWGVEIKNTWAYIDREEMEIKINLSAFLGLKPLFIVRFSSKSYVELVRQAGGFSLLYKTQLFPPGHSAAVERLKELGFPVATCQAVPDDNFRRFVKYHDRLVRR